MKRSFRIEIIALVVLAAVVTAGGRAHAQQPAKPAADVTDAKYGPHERNVIDLWKAKSDKPTPLVIFIHGGGFRAGDKTNLDADLLAKCLEAGISVAAINYRFSQHAPYPADSGRAVQFGRSKDWNSTRSGSRHRRLGRCGISCGLAFRDDWPTRRARSGRANRRDSRAAVLAAGVSPAA